MLLTKSKFAAYIGVVPSRVSQYIATGQIGPEAIVGGGRSAKIDVRIAVLQLRERRHVGQALGNGWKTRLVLPPETIPSRNGFGDMPRVDLPSDTVGEKILGERLEQLRRQNRQDEERFQRENGRLVLAAEVERQVALAQHRMVLTIDGWAEDIAREVALQCGIPFADVLVEVRKVFAAGRAKFLRGGP